MEKRGEGRPSDIGCVVNCSETVFVECLLEDEVCMEKAESNKVIERERKEKPHLRFGG